MVCTFQQRLYICNPFPGKFDKTHRGVAEWSNAAVLKTVVPRGTGGSNPSSSAPKTRPNGLVFLFTEIDKRRRHRACPVPTIRNNPASMHQKGAASKGCQIDLSTEFDLAAPYHGLRKHSPCPSQEGNYPFRGVNPDRSIRALYLRIEIFLFLNQGLNLSYFLAALLVDFSRKGTASCQLSASFLCGFCRFSR